MDLKLPPLPNKRTPIEQKIDTDDRILEHIALGPRGAWFTRWSDGYSGWENIPATLHTKLFGRPKSLPRVRSLCMPSPNDWIVIFDDGSIASSGFRLNGRLEEELRHTSSDSDARQLVLAPGGGWILTRMDGSVSWDRLPTGLDELLRKRTPHDPHIDQVAVSGIGGWFIRFADGECAWESLPDVQIANQHMQTKLIQLIRKGNPSILSALSPCDGYNFFLAIGHEVIWIHDGESLGQVLEWGSGRRIEISDNVIVTRTPPATD